MGIVFVFCLFFFFFFGWTPPKWWLVVLLLSLEHPQKGGGLKKRQTQSTLGRLPLNNQGNVRVTLTDPWHLKILPASQEAKVSLGLRRSWGQKNEKHTVRVKSKTGAKKKVKRTGVEGLRGSSFLGFPFAKQRYYHEKVGARVSRVAAICDLDSRNG